MFDHVSAAVWDLVGRLIKFIWEGSLYRSHWPGTHSPPGAQMADATLTCYFVLVLYFLNRAPALNPYWC